MSPISPAMSRVSAPPDRQVNRAAARRLLTEAATLDLDQPRLLVRCRLGIHADWWHLDEAVSLLELATGIWYVPVGDGRQLLVFDGYDRYSFDVS